MQKVHVTLLHGYLVETKVRKKLYYALERHEISTKGSPDLSRGILDTYYFLEDGGQSHRTIRHL